MKRLKMSDAKARVINELNEVKDRLHKLNKFLLKESINQATLNKDEIETLYIQKSIMESYMSILQYRLDRWREV
jgi:hypothetical protein